MASKKSNNRYLPFRVNERVYLKQEKNCKEIKN